jgi:YD repeat-containing protein
MTIFLKAKSYMSGYALAFPSDARQKLDRELDGLVGPVSTVRLQFLRTSKVAWLFPIKKGVPLRKVSYNVDGNKTKAISYDPANPGNKQTEFYSYDAAGRKIEWLVRQGVITRKTVYRYDDKAGKLEALEQVTERKHTIATRNYVSIFDNQGNQIEACCSDNSGAIAKAFYRYKSDEKGNVRIIETYNDDGFLYHKIVCSYDLSGRLNMKSLYGPGDILYERRVFAYGVDGTTEEKLTYDDTSLVRKIVYRYDNKENLIEVAGYDANSSILGSTANEFQYDEIGNWIEKRSQSWNLKTGKYDSERIEYRVIHYR